MLAQSAATGFGNFAACAMAGMCSRRLVEPAHGAWSGQVPTGGVLLLRTVSLHPAKLVDPTEQAPCAAAQGQALRPLLATSPPCREIDSLRRVKRRYGILPRPRSPW